jgi:hypothetical protein
MLSLNSATLYAMIAIQTRLVALVIVTCLLEVPIHGRAAQTRTADKMQQKVSFAVHNQSVLEAVIALGINEQLPMGITLRQPEDLCKPQKTRTFTDVSVDALLSLLLADTDYKWTEADGVIEIGPGKRREAETTFLNMRINKFGAPSSTIQGAGIVLSGYITALLHPGQGYAGDILSSSDSEKTPPVSLHNTSVEQIANFIVSLGSKGVWILTPTAPSESAGNVKITDLRLSTYGYKDDANVLRNRLCIKQ